MHSFIALVKKSNPQTTNSGASLIDDKQPRQSSNKSLPKLTDAVIQKIAEPLAVLGFKRVPAQVSVDESVLDDEQVSNFVTLDYLGADVVSSSNKQRIVEAQKSFDKSDYEIIPNVQLSLIGNDGPGSMHAPGYFPETVSAGAIDFHHQPAPFSGGGISPIGGEMQPDIAGYGIDIFSSLERDTNNRSLYTYMSGTSMATPYVAGIAALYASADAKLQGKALRQHLLNTALPLQAPADRVGAGLARFTENGNKNP